jgi:hypothetical protein
VYRLVLAEMSIKTASRTPNTLFRVREPTQIPLELIADNIELARSISSNAR